MNVSRKNSRHDTTSRKSNHEKENNMFERYINLNSDNSHDKMNREEERQEDLEDHSEWLEGIEDSFCELKSISKEELIPYYSEIKRSKKSFLDTNSSNTKHVGDRDTYT